MHPSCHACNTNIPYRPRREFVGIWKHSSCSCSFVYLNTVVTGTGTSVHDVLFVSLSPYPSSSHFYLSLLHLRLLPFPMSPLSHSFTKDAAKFANTADTNEPGEPKGKFANGKGNITIPIVFPFPSLSY